MENIYRIIARISIFIYPVWLQNKVRNQFDKIYTWRISSQFKSFRGGRIERYIHIWNGQNITIGSNVNIGKNSLLATHPNPLHLIPEIIIGNCCNFGEQVHITCANRIKIGNGLLTGRRCTITDNSHGKSDRSILDMNPSMRTIESKGSVVIGNNVWLGDNVIVLPGVTIGDGVIVGANSVVTKNIPSYSVAVGNPAKVVKSFGR